MGQAITVKEADALFEKDLAIVVKDLDRNLSFWKDLDPVAQEIMRNLTFNLGIRKLMKFHNTLRAMKEHRYADAADHLTKSLWYKQVGRRGIEIVKALRDLGNQ
jgi:GH24 family phage-related lysozyme (muramidase)